ncbi:MAG: ABC transporter ATP-binding protein [Halanaerobium sp.]|nr:ABC transporter ATP-binding protein [Halanaerobium sp.]
MIEVKNLKKNYGEKAALRGIDLQVKEGELFGYLGPNGAGKTTTIKILTGQLLPSYGEARIRGKDVIKEADIIRPDMGIVPENTNLYERLSIGQNLLFFARLYGSDPGVIDTYLERVNLHQDKDTPVKKLSKGMKQKVLLVRALLHRPDVLFLDEPTSGLDPASADSIHQILLELNKGGMTIFLTSHNMEEVEKLCHRVAFLDAGQIAAMGTPEELKLKYTSSKMRALVRTEKGLQERILDLAGEESASLLAQWVRDGQLEAIHSSEPTLADIFVRITGRDL